MLQLSKALFPMPLACAKRFQLRLLPFAVSFYSARMGGVYFLLKLRDSKPSEHAGKIKLRNILIYTVLATWLRLACGFCLNQVAFFQVEILVEGFFFTYTPMSFSLRFFSSSDTLGDHYD